MRTLITVLVIMLLAGILPLQASETTRGKLIEELNTAAQGAVNQKDLDSLSKSISAIFDRYKFSDSDIEALGTETVSAVFAVGGFYEQLKNPEETPAAPRKEVRSFFSSLSGFVQKYRISGEDTLVLARDITQVAMGTMSKSASGTAAKPSPENMAAIFSRLIDFSRAHRIQTEDLMPIASNLGDMGLSVIQNEAMKKKLEKTDPDRAKELALTHGISQEQVKSLMGSLMSFQRKYKIELGEIIRLADDIRKNL